MDADAGKAERLEAARNNLQGINEDFRRAQLLKKAEPAFQQARDAMEAVSSGGLSRDEIQAQKEAFDKAGKQVRSIGADAGPSNRDAATRMANDFAEMKQQFITLTKAIENNTNATVGNTVAQPKAINTPTPRPTNITTLQNARPK